MTSSDEVEVEVEAEGNELDVDGEGGRWTGADERIGNDAAVRCKEERRVSERRETTRDGLLLVEKARGGRTLRVARARRGALGRHGLDSDRLYGRGYARLDLLDPSGGLRGRARRRPAPSRRRVAAQDEARVVAAESCRPPACCARRLGRIAAHLARFACEEEEEATGSASSDERAARVGELGWTYKCYTLRPSAGCAWTTAQSCLVSVVTRSRCVLRVGAVRGRGAGRGESGAR